jgi:hypothetical protein
MDASVRRSSRQLSGRQPSARLLCVALVAGALACAAPTAAGAEAPPLASVGGGNGENLSIGISWGLYEERVSQAQDSIGIVGAPMPFLMGLMDSGENRLFIFVQRSLPGGRYCAETPAQLEDISVDLTAATGDPTIAGPAYSKTYVWTPIEAGEYALCAYLDATAADHPAAINFLKLTADPAPGRLSFVVTPEADDPERITVKTEGTAAVRSELTASMQEQGLPCTLPEGGLAGQLLEPLGSADAGSRSSMVGAGPFTTSYTFTATKPGPYEVCAYLTPAATENMYFARPYEVGSADFFVQEAPASLSNQQVVIPAASEAPPSPKLGHVSISNSRFRVARAGVHSTRRTPVGTKFRFAVSTPATVTIAISRLLPGVVLGRRCAPLLAAAVSVHARRCNGSVAVGSIILSRAFRGGTVIPFSGVVGHRKLAAGSYSAAVTATNANGRSGLVTLRFSVAL